MRQTTILTVVALASLTLLACSDDSTAAPGPGPDAGIADAATPADGGSAADGASADGPGAQWKVPSCSAISGFAGVGFGRNHGNVVQASKVPFPKGQTFTTGMAALGRPDTLLALHELQLLRSEDAGCTWSKVGTVEERGLTLTPGAGDLAWAWRRNDGFLYRVEGSSVTRLTPPVSNIMGLMGHRARGGLVRVGGKGGAIYESNDRGKSWKKLSAGAQGSGSTYFVAFDPGDLDHVAVGFSHRGLSVTTDGGKTWKASTGLSASGGKVNGFNAVFSRKNGNVVWASALDLSASGASMGRHIYYSADGGLSFTPVVTHQQHKDVILTNGLHMIPHPSDDNTLYFTYGTCASRYGTNLYRYEASHDVLTWKNHPYPGFGEVVVSPADPGFLYLAIHGNDDPICPKHLR